MKWTWKFAWYIASLASSISALDITKKSTDAAVPTEDIIAKKTNFSASVARKNPYHQQQPCPVYYGGKKGGAYYRPGFPGYVSHGYGGFPVYAYDNGHGYGYGGKKGGYGGKKEGYGGKKGGYGLYGSKKGGKKGGKRGGKKGGYGGKKGGYVSNKRYDCDYDYSPGYEYYGGKKGGYHGGKKGGYGGKKGAYTATTDYYSDYDYYLYTDDDYNHGYESYGGKKGGYGGKKGGQRVAEKYYTYYTDNYYRYTGGRNTYHTDYYTYHSDEPPYQPQPHPPDEGYTPTPPEASMYDTYSPPSTSQDRPVISVVDVATSKIFVDDYDFEDDYDSELMANLSTDDFRFNKFGFKSSDMNGNIKPLTRQDYPISGHVNETLRESNAYSVITEDDYECVYNVTNIIDIIGGLPPQPSSDPKSEFWDMLREVIDVQEQRRNNPSVQLFPRPDNWKNNDLNEVAEYVHNEFPGTHQAILLGDFINHKWGKMKLDLNIIPFRSNNMFLRKDFMLSAMNTWTMSVVGPHSFAAKWSVGRPRPEEVVWAIKQGIIVDGVPDDVRKRVQQLQINSAREFTAYDEGAPRHPSWPAMHAASTSISFWASIVLDLNSEQLCQARLTDYGISFARTVAGVHYPDDNISGMNLSQEVLAKALPQYLKDRYNADPIAVAEKINQNRFDWRDFDPNDPCAA